MNMIVVDLSKLKEVKIEDEVVLIGEQKDNTITADEIANKVGSINYEVVTRLSSILPRVIK